MGPDCSIAPSGTDRNAAFSEGWLILLGPCQVIRYRFLDPDASAKVIAKGCGNAGSKSASGVWIKSLPITGSKKNPTSINRDQHQIETQRTSKKVRREPSDPTSIERGVRQLLADKVSGDRVA